MSRMRVLVTGGTGFIARALFPKLIAQANVTLLLQERRWESVTSRAADSHSQSGCGVVYADLRSLAETVEAVEEAEPDRVIHLAAAGVTEPFLDVGSAISHNVVGTTNLLRACFELASKPIEQFIVARTPGERTAMNVYAASKSAAWEFCRMFARTDRLPIQGAMIFQAYGPGQSPNSLVPAAIRKALIGEDLPMTQGTQEKDWIYIDDIVGGFLALLATPLPPGETVELGRGNPITVREVVEEIYRSVGRGGEPLIGALPGRPGEETRQVADSDRTARLINWRAQVPLHEGLQRTIGYYRRQSG